MADKIKRDTVIIDETTALEHVKDGMTIALGGFITTQHPMSMIRGIAKRGVKDLTVIGSLSPALDVDLLIGCGCVRRLIAAYVGAEASAPMGPFFKKAAEEEAIDIWESDEIIIAAMLKATAFGLPFFPLRGGLGTDLPELNPDLKPFNDPISNEPLLAVPAMHIDIAFTHASKSDPYGNTQYIGNSFVDSLMCRAADLTITTVEKIVAPEEIRRDPFKTEYKADWIVRAPFGAHPYSCHGFYLEDEHHLTEYAMAAYGCIKGDPEGWDSYREKYIDTPSDHMDYLEQVGIRKLFSLNEY